MNDVSINELIYLAQEQNEDALNLIIEKYKYLLNVIIKKYYVILKNANADYKDVYAEAYIGLLESIKNYNPNKDASFSTFASLIISRKVIKYVVYKNRKKNVICDNCYSLDYVYDETDVTLTKYLKDYSNEPLKLISNDEDFCELKNKIKSVLSNFEYLVYTYLIKGWNYKEIALKLNKTNKQIDNTIQRIKKKIKSCLT